MDIPDRYYSYATYILPIIVSQVMCGLVISFAARLRYKMVSEDCGKRWNTRRGEGMYGEFFTDFVDWIFGRDPEQRARAQMVFNLLMMFFLGMLTIGAFTWGEGFFWIQIYVVLILTLINVGLWFTVLAERIKDRIPEKLHAAIGVGEGDMSNSSTPKVLRHTFDAVAIYLVYDLYVRVYEWIEFNDLTFAPRIVILVSTCLTILCTAGCIYLSFFLQNNGDKNMLGWFVGKQVELFGTDDKSLLEGFVLLFFGLAVFVAMVPCLCVIGLVSTGLFVAVVLCLMSPLAFWEFSSWPLRIVFIVIAVAIAIPLISMGISYSELNVSHLDQLEDLKIKFREENKR